MPYVMVADEVFPLSKHIMRPYGGNNLDRDQQIFNYRLSRARIMVEGAFGLLVARWRVLESRLQIPPTTATAVVKACCILNKMSSALHVIQQTSKDLWKMTYALWELEINS